MYALVLLTTRIIIVLIVYKFYFTMRFTDRFYNNCRYIHLFFARFI